MAYSTITQASQLALVSHPAEVSPDVPVLVVHGASPAGLRRWGEACQLFGDRAIDVGLAPRIVIEAGKIVALRAPALPDEVTASLPAN